MISLELALSLGFVVGALLITALCGVLGLVIDRFVILHESVRRQFRIGYVSGLITFAVASMLGNALLVTGHFTAGRTGFLIAVLGLTLVFGTATFPFVQRFRETSRT